MMSDETTRESTSAWCRVRKAAYRPLGSWNWGVKTWTPFEFIIEINGGNKVWFFPHCAFSFSLFPSRYVAWNDLQIHWAECSSWASYFFEMFGTRLSTTPGNSTSFIRRKKEHIADHPTLIFLSFHVVSQFTWLLDSQPILDVTSLHRYAMGQYVDISGDVISHLNISHVHAEDGGLYKCIAANSVGSASHSARLNIFGQPFVRAISPVKAIAGEDFIVFCPFSGYPIENIRWEKAGIEITSSKKQLNYVWSISWNIKMFLISPKILDMLHQIFSKAVSSESIKSIRLTILEATRASYDQEMEMKLDAILSLT